jgi:5-methylcytosine-specific restriction endonuclease McrA
MAEPSLIALLFRAQTIHRKTKLANRSRSRKRTVRDGREILSGYQYELRRREVLKRDGYRCVRCGSGLDIEVHHKTKRSLSRDDRMPNLVTLCESCHRVEHEG